MTLETHENIQPEFPPMALTEVLREWKFETPRPIDDSEKILRLEKEGEMELVGGEHVNKVEFVNLRDDGAVIFKPYGGESRDFRQYNQFKNEEAAYLVDVFIDFGLVPPTVVRQFDGKLGSAQEFVPDAKNGFETADEVRKNVPPSEYVKLSLFDYVIGNSDRHSGNYLLKNNQIIAIDNGLAFRNYPIYPDGALGVSIPNEIIEKFRFFRNWPDGKEALLDLLERRLSKEQAEACLTRIERLGTLLIQKGKIEYEDFKFLD